MNPDGPVSFDELKAKEPAAPEDSFSLAISGGGIRSATFALGVLQSLAKRGLLVKLDYLSTVSGGGYIGSWLSGWIDRAGGVRNVQSALVPPPFVSEEAKEIGWLRRYGKYLAPDASLFSADTWMIFAIWARNTLLVGLLLIALLVAVAGIPWLLLSLQNVPNPLLTGESMYRLGLGILAVAALLVEIGIWKRAHLFGHPFGFVAAILVCAASMLLVAAGAPKAGWEGLAAGVLLSLIVMVGSMLSKGVSVPRVLIGAVFGAGAFSVFDKFLAAGSDALKDTGLTFIFLPPITALYIAVVVAMLIGIAGVRLLDDHREYWSRTGAWMLIFGGGGLALGCVALLGPASYYVLREQLYLGLATGAIWTAASAMAVLFGRSPSTGGPQRTHPVVEALLPAAAGICVTGFLILLSTAVFLSASGVLLKRQSAIGLPRIGECASSCQAFNGAAPGPASGASAFRLDSAGHMVKIASAYASCVETCEKEIAARGFVTTAKRIFDQYLAIANQLKDASFWGKLVLASLLFYVGFSRLIDVNEFSLHSFYRNRLARAYLGASNPTRRWDKDPFTNLSLSDDVPLTSLQNQRPIHLVNTAANVNLEDAGLDERRAASFVFTPWGCGYTLATGNGDRENYRLFEPGHGVGLATPLTISGAAASPNMGYHTTKSIAFLLTLFNVRLGYWIFNTASDVLSLGNIVKKNAALTGLNRNWNSRARWVPSGPQFGASYYLLELFGIAHSRRKYIYLSDGGHFENLGVYELLRRRRPFILCIDGEEDGGMCFEGLGNLIRKARQDLGTEIKIDTSSIEERDAEGWSNRHCAAGTIAYPGGGKGTLIYIKLSVTGDEPVDVLHYRKLNPEFPHQSTLDQMFSESQFESYRALGFHVAETVFQPVTQTDPAGRIFENLAKFWTGVPRKLSNNFTRNTEQFIRLLDTLRTDPDLHFLAVEFDDAPGPAPQPTPAAQVRAFYVCQQLIQLMENVYVDLDLENNYAHPEFTGWMAQFRRWTKSPTFQSVYNETKDTFGALFTSFYERTIQSQ